MLQAICNMRAFLPERCHLNGIIQYIYIVSLYYRVNDTNKKALERMVVGNSLVYFLLAGSSTHGDKTLCRAAWNNTTVTTWKYHKDYNLIGFPMVSFARGLETPHTLMIDGINTVMPDQMVIILQTTFSKAFSLMIVIAFCWCFHWRLSVRVQLTKVTIAMV